MKPPRRNWENAPTIFVVRPACPHCGCERYEKVKTYPNGDGSSTKHCECRECHEIYKICCESPDSGLEIIWPL